MRRLVYVGPVLVTVLLAASCRGASEAPRSTAGSTSRARTAFDSSKATATVTAKVVFDGAKPAPQKIQMSADPYCASHASDTVSHELEVNADGTLQDVIVYVKSGLPTGMTYPTPTEPMTVDQRGCRYVPRAFTVMTNQPIRILNSDATLHNIHAWAEQNQPFNFGQPVQGLEQVKTFERPEMPVPIKCDVHPWMQASVGVFDHPFHGVTGNAGAVTMKLLPGKYEIEAWHPKFGPATQTVEVTDNGQTQIVFTFKQAPANATN